MLIELFLPMPGTLRHQPQETVPDDEEIGQRAGDEQAMGILVEATVADLGEAEHPLDDADDVLDLAAHAGLGAVLSALLALATDEIRTGNSATVSVLALSVLKFLNPGDYVEVWVYQDSGSALDIDRGRSLFEVELLR